MFVQASLAVDVHPRNSFLMEAPCVLHEMQIESLYIVLINFSRQTVWHKVRDVLPVIRLSDLTIISPVLHNHIHLIVALIRTDPCSKW